MEIEYMVQCDKFCNCIKEPYHMEPNISVKNAMYCRYIGPEETLKFGYDKIYLEAFEKDITLKKNSIFKQNYNSY